MEFHLAHNYLPHSFLSAGFNHREDEYGGSFENRCRFPLEVIDEIRKNMPEGMPLFIRIDAQDDMLENGLTIEDVIRFCKIAKEHGVDVLDVSRGNIITAAFEMAEQVEKLVKVYKNTKVDAQMLKDADVDAVILAIGSSPITIKLEGMDKLQHASAPEVLRHEVCPKGKVAVIGGGLVGLETADTLATDGCDVTVLEMKDEIGSDLGSLRKIAVMMKLQQMQVKMLPNSKVCKFTEEGIVLEDETLVPCNCAVFAVGFASNDSHLLVEECEKRQIPCRVIGDAKSARRALDAIAEGFEAARTL